MNMNSSENREAKKIPMILEKKKELICVDMTISEKIKFFQNKPEKIRRNPLNEENRRRR